MNQFYIRIDDNPGYKEKLVDFLTDTHRDRFSEYLMIAHTGKKGENPHFHISCTTDYKQLALRTQLKKSFPRLDGNKTHSVKVWDGCDKVNSYAFHEEGAEIITTTYSNEYIQEMRKVNEEFQEVKKKNNPTSIVSEVCDILSKSKRFQHTHEQIAHCIWDRLKQRGDWFPNKYQLERWIMKVQGDMSDDRSWKATKDTWYRQMFPTF